MFRVELDKTGKYCDGVSRRSFVQLGMAGMASVGLGELARARAASAGTTGRRTANSVILVWLDGGPSHLDLYDMKPEAPAEYRGIWKPIPTNVVGTEISELFPKQATVADKFSIVRSLYHNSGDHFTGGHAMLTSRAAGVSGANTQGKYPSIGSIATKLLGPNKPGMPAYVGIPYSMSIGIRPGYFGGNYLGVAHDPFDTGSDPNNPNFQVQNVQLASGLSIEMLEDRRKLNQNLDRLRRQVDASGTLDAMDRFDQEAFEMVAGPNARRAFDLSKEDPRLRDRYGRHTWGQSALLARRLVEAGSTFVTLHLGGWDHHWNLQSGMESYLPRVDSLYATLLSDLDDRGLLDSTLVILCGEFSRTPRMNDGSGNGTPGRDHWGASMFCLMGGGGVKRGVVYGATDRLGQRPAKDPVQPANIHATIYKVLGIDPTYAFTDLAGRPVPILDDPEPIHALL